MGAYQNLDYVVFGHPKAEEELQDLRNTLRDARQLIGWSHQWPNDGAQEAEKMVARIDAVLSRKPEGLEMKFITRVVMSFVAIILLIAIAGIVAHISLGT